MITNKTLDELTKENLRLSSPEFDEVIIQELMKLKKITREEALKYITEFMPPNAKKN